MKVIKITNYNSIHVIEIVKDVIYFRWNNEPRKHRAKIRQDEHGRDYFKSYNLSIGLNTGYKIRVLTRQGNGWEAWTTELNGCKPFETKEQAEKYISDGGLYQYTYTPVKWEIIEA
jgi:hypothetical protein